MHSNTSTAASVSMVGTSPAQPSRHRIAIGVIARELEDADAGGAMLNAASCRAIGFGLFAGDNDVHEVSAAQALVRHAQQCVGVGEDRPHDVRLLVDHDIEKPGS